MLDIKSRRASNEGLCWRKVFELAWLKSYPVYFTRKLDMLRCVHLCAALFLMCYFNGYSNHPIFNVLKNLFIFLIA